MKSRNYDLYEFEDYLYSDGYLNIAGVDEAGRGPLAGPLCVAACILPAHYINDEINDSKKLTEKKREELYDVIIRDAISYSIIFIDEITIDIYNIYEATKMGMRKAIESLDIKPDYVLIDAMPLDVDVKHESIIKGDARSISIAAASILAKVTRDRYMVEMDNKYPGYDFIHNKGYGTKKHLEALEKLGPTKIHRKTYGPVSDCYKKNAQLSIFDCFEEN